MFSLIKLLLSLALVAGLGVGLFYFLPQNMKIKGVEALINFAPDVLKEKAEEFLLTPSELRERTIQDAEKELAEIRAKNNDLETEAALVRTEILLSELKEKNDELSIGEIVKTELVKKFLESQSTTTPICLDN